MGQVPRSKRFGLIKAALLHTMQTVFLCMLYYFFFSCFFWRCVNIYFYFFVRKCFQNSIWTFFFVHIFFEIIIYFGLSFETKLSKMIHCAWIDETIEHNFLNFWTNFDFKEWIGWDFMAEIANTWDYNWKYARKSNQATSGT